MRKIAIFFIVFVLVFPIFSQGQQDGKKILKIKKAFAYEDATLLISESDVNCAYFIGKRIKRDIEVTGAETAYLHKTIFSDGDKVFINKGSRNGIKEGDVFLLLAAGEKVKNPKKLKNLGTYYLKKSLGDVTCIFEDRAIVTLKNGCYPVCIGDILIPYKKEETLIKREINYMKCRLPKS